MHSHPWYILTIKNITKGLFTIANTDGIVKFDQVHPTRFTESSETAMATKSAPTEKLDGKSPATQATTSRTDARIINSCLVDANRVTSVAQKTRQPLTKILVCDDNPAECESVCTCLQQITDREIVCLQAGHMQEIQNALHEGRIDLVLMDDQMTRKSGREWLAEISKKQLAPVIMLTGAEAEETAAQTLQEGVVCHLPKGSLSLDKLSSTINAALDEWIRLQQAKADGEKLERLATFDPLTGLYNLHAILGRLREQVNLANRYQENFSLILLDIDHFRKVNDRYGHLIGDQVLEKVAALIRGSIRDTDIAGRYGGQEFIIVLPRTDLASSWVAAERLRSIVEMARMKDSGGNVFSITVSQGLVGWERKDDAASLISRADEALCKAKEKGRNRVQILLGPSLRDKI
jgi:diguanylate cyclase (GGDEF)-like protein